MQGKERNQGSEFSEAFLDQSWGEMSQLLDREMPVAPKPARTKRYALLLLLLLFGFAAGVGSTYYFANEPAPVAPVKEEKIKELRASVDPVESTTIVSTTSDVQNTSSTSTAKTTYPENTNGYKTSIAPTQSTNPKPIELGTKTMEVVNEIAQNNHSNLASIAVARETSEKELWNENNGIANGVNALEIAKQVNEQIGASLESNATSVLAQASNKVEPFEENQDIASLEPLELPTSEMPMLTSEDRDLSNDFVIPSVSRWRFGAMAGVNLSNAGFAGWSVNAIADFQLTPALSLQAGLGFTSLHKDELFNAESIDLNNLYEKDATVDFLQSEDLIAFPLIAPNNMNEERVIDADLESIVQQGYDLSLHRLNYINAPLVVAYQPVAFFKVLAGMNLALRINNFSFVKGTSEVLQDGFGEFAPIERSINNDSVNRIFENGIRKIEFSGILGVGFYPNENMGIDFRYNFGFQDFSLNGIFGVEESHYNQNLQISFVHYFGRR